MCFQRIEFQDCSHALLDIGNRCSCEDVQMTRYVRPTKKQKLIEYKNKLKFISI